MADIIIPRAALDAGVKAFAEADQVNDYTSQAEDLATAFLAMLTAWPGMHGANQIGGVTTPLILPFPPQEASDDQ